MMAIADRPATHEQSCPHFMLDSNLHFAPLYWISNHREVRLEHRKVAVDLRHFLFRVLPRHQLLHLLVEEDQRLAIVQRTTHHGRHVAS